MACTGRYAEAWEYASFWCVGLLLHGYDDSGGAGNAFLTDSTAAFRSSGVKASVGMVLYNLTDGSSGPVTSVTETTLTATLTGGTANNWDNGDEYRIVLIDRSEIATIQNYLDISASDIHAALASVDACNCTLAAWGAAYLKKLNIIEAETFYSCPCARTKLSDEMRQKYIDWMQAQMDAITSGKVDVCSGATGSDFPALGWADQSVTEFAAAKIISNDIDRNTTI